MTWSDTLAALRADLYRMEAGQGWKHCLHQFFTAPNFRYMALFRLCQQTRQGGLMKWLLYPGLVFWFGRVSRRYGVRIPLPCKVGPGLYIAHWGSIWVNPEVSIGANCTIAHEVTLGRASRGPTKGAPTLGDKVYLGPGAKVVGAVKIANEALISANSLVMSDVPEKGVVIGVPGRVISHAGSEGYVSNTWPPQPAETEGHTEAE
jgi:serine O-acetyltransferase